MSGKVSGRESRGMRLPTRARHQSSSSTHKHPERCRPMTSTPVSNVASVTGLRGQALRDRLLSSTDDLGPAGYDTSFGNGWLNSYRAVTGTSLDEGPQPPTDPLAASFTFQCTGYACLFDGSGSTGNVVSYAWSTSDGGTGGGATFGHTFPGDGSYSVSLTVGDGSATDTATQSIRCRQRGPNVRCN